MEGALLTKFWATLQRLDPSAYVAGGEFLTLVTKSEADRDRAWQFLETLRP
jgi:hypothetical protein